MEEKETCRGKKSEGVEEGAENSIDPDFEDASTSDKDQVSVFLRESWLYCPSHSFTTGLQPIGRGILISTLFNSRSMCSNSYSMLTSHPPSPFSEGQQFTVIGME